MHRPDFQQRLAARILAAVGAACLVTPAACSSSKPSTSTGGTAAHASSSSGSSSGAPTASSSSSSGGGHGGAATASSSSSGAGGKSMGGASAAGGAGTGGGDAGNPDATSDGTGGTGGTGIHPTTKVCFAWPAVYDLDAGADGSASEGGTGTAGSSANGGSSSDGGSPSDAGSTGGSNTATGGAGGATGDAGGTGGSVPIDAGPCPTDFGEVLAIFLSFNCPRGWEPFEVVSGPVDPPTPGECCYQTYTKVCGPGGRPYVQKGEAVLAEARGATGATGWVDGTLPDLAGLTAEDRARLASEWTEDALREHASVASFSRVSLALLAVGAPAELLRKTHEAASDEVRHARRCFALASAYAGETVAPGPFPMGGRVQVATALAELAASTVLEGCLGETVAASLAAEQLARATDPAVRAVLAEITEDESRHAELAWQTVGWALSVGGDEVRAAVAEAFSRGVASLVAASPEDRPPVSPRVAQHGRLDAARVAKIMAEVASGVVRPCADALLSLGNPVGVPQTPPLVSLDNPVGVPQTPPGSTLA